MRTAFAVAVVTLLTMPATVMGERDPHRDRNHDNKGRGKRIERSVFDLATSGTEGGGIRIERSVPEPATILLLGAAAGVAYGVRKLRSKRRKRSARVPVVNDTLSIDADA